MVVADLGMCLLDGFQECTISRLGDLHKGRSRNHDQLVNTQRGRAGVVLGGQIRCDRCDAVKRGITACGQGPARGSTALYKTQWRATRHSQNKETL